jgi:hypothetical protein
VLTNGEKWILFNSATFYDPVRLDRLGNPITPSDKCVHGSLSDHDFDFEQQIVARLRDARR